MTSSSDIAVWFDSDLRKWRTGAAVAWSVCLSPLFVTLYIILANFSILHPVSMVTDSCWSILSPSQWKFLILLGIIIGFQGVKNARMFSVVATVKTSKLAVIWSILSPGSLIYIATHSLGAAMATWCCCSLIGGEYSDLTSQNSSDSDPPCLNERHLFLMLHGAFVGMMYAADFILSDQGYMVFPAIQQSKYQRTRSQLFCVTKKSTLKVLWNLRYYYPLYYLFANIPKGAIFVLLNIGKRPDIAAIDSWRGIFDLCLFWMVLLTGAVVRTLFSLTGLLHTVYHTEAYPFSMDSQYVQQKKHTLLDALSCQQVAPVQHLAFLDLSQLSKYSLTRRKEIFCLSQPGGHPHNWNAVRTECLATLEALANQITLHHEKAASSQPIKGPHANRAHIMAQTGNFNRTSPATENLTFRGSPTSLQPGVTEPPKRSPTFIQKIKENLKKKKLIAHLIEEIPDRGSRALFACSQKHVWALEALSHLAVSSYTEDPYGVVQMSLPDIISAILRLEEVVDRHFKTMTSMTRHPAPDGSSRDVVVRFTLRSTIKAALYRISTTFEKHISDLSLSQEQLKKMKSYSAFME